MRRRNHSQNNSSSKPTTPPWRAKSYQKNNKIFVDLYFIFNHSYFSIPLTFFLEGESLLLLERGYLMVGVGVSRITKSLEMSLELFIYFNFSVSHNFPGRVS